MIFFLEKVTIEMYLSQDGSAKIVPKLPKLETHTSWLG